MRTYQGEISSRLLSTLLTLRFVLNSGLMVSVLISRSRGADSSPGLGRCFMFLGKIHYSQSVSLHLSVQMGTGEFYTGGNPAMEQHLIQGGVQIFLVASCYRNRDKLRPDVPLLTCRLYLTPCGTLSQYRTEIRGHERKHKRQTNGF